MKHFKLIGSLVLLIATIAAGSLQAQQLSLSSALELADRQNLDLVAARAREGISKAGIEMAKKRPNPVLDVIPGQRNVPHEGIFFDLPVEIGGQRFHRIDVALQERRLTEVEIATAERQVRRATRVAFYAVAFSRAKTNQLRGLERLAEHLREIAEQRYTAGDVPQLEVIQAELELKRAQADVQASQQRENVALSQLNALLNQPATTAWQLTGSLEDRVPQIDLQELVLQAYSQNYDVVHLEQEQKVEASRLRLVKSQRIPNLDLQFGSDYNAPGQFQAGPRSLFSITVPLFYRNQGEIAQSLANELVLEHQLAATKRSVAATVESAYYELAANQLQVSNYRSTLLPTARKLESMAEESYQAGKMNILYVLDAQRNVQQVESGYLDSLLAVQNAFAVLEETVGASLDR